MAARSQSAAASCSRRSAWNALRPCSVYIAVLATCVAGQHFASQLRIS